MEQVTEEQYRHLVEAGEVLSRDGYGEKVIQLPDGLLVKAFRLKRPWSSGLWKPYAVRFAENAARLDTLRIPTVAVEKVAYCASRKRHLVFYRPLAGETLRDRLAAAPAEDDVVMEALVDFLAELHRLGIYFRSVHFGNVVVRGESQGLGLIDVADMRFRRKALGPVMRARNFRHLCRYVEDRSAFDRYGVERFVTRYLMRSELSADQARAFLKQLQVSLPWFADQIVNIENTERVQQ